MSMKNEFAEIIKAANILDWAEKVSTKQTMTKEETEVSQIVDAWSKDIGEKGCDDSNENFIKVYKN